ncbi:unnamed protein product [Microthlaspi erraticum]|uniref:Uncharacterized protein n=1 Tax=Microthlaspi erraticum TaxID=1685480 RepID=A0A6D2L612_9BRAS|nr:unnamed protein product [Microthlaspi erraticum]
MRVPAMYLKGLGSTCKPWNGMFNGDWRFAREHTHKAAKQFLLVSVSSFLDSLLALFRDFRFRRERFRRERRESTSDWNLSSSYASASALLRHCRISASNSSSSCSCESRSGAPVTIRNLLAPLL